MRTSEYMRPADYKTDLPVLHPVTINDSGAAPADPFYIQMVWGMHRWEKSMKIPGYGA